MLRSKCWKITESIDAYEVEMNVFKSATCQLLNKRQQYIYMLVHL